MTEGQSYSISEKQIAIEETVPASYFSSSEANNKTAPLLGVASLRRGADNNVVAVKANEQYPSGIRLALILLALCLAIFLTSLDMVRLRSSQTVGQLLNSVSMTDHCLYCYSRYYRRI